MVPETPGFPKFYIKHFICVSNKFLMAVFFLSIKIYPLEG